MGNIRGYVFDAYGTLFDVHAVVEAGRALTADPLTLSVMWRQKQLEYAWLRALMGRYEDFWVITESALRWTVRRLGITADEAQISRLMEAYLSLACFPEVPAALQRLESHPRAILSNGSPAMLQAAVASSGIGRHLSHVLSVDAVRTYKPSPAVYALASAGPRHPRWRPALRLVQRLGRGRRQGVRLSGGVVQPTRGAGRGAWRACRPGNQPARRATPVSGPSGGGARHLGTLRRGGSIPRRRCPRNT